MVAQSLRGFVRGLSMWPALVPGDVLRAEPREVRSVRPGQVVVLGHPGPTPVVHRVSRILGCARGLLLFTAGDRSGPDTLPTLLPCRHRIPVITGVLRGGKYRCLSGRFPWARRAPGLAVTLHCALVRRLARR